MWRVRCTVVITHYTRGVVLLYTRALFIFLNSLSVFGGVHQFNWKKLKNFLKKAWPNQWDPSFLASFFGFTSSPVELDTDLTWWKS